MSIRNRIFKIETEFGPITFLKRDIGSKGRDILALKVALGTLISTPLSSTPVFEDHNINEAWFDCSSGEPVSTMESILFDKNLQRALMTFQINNQYSIFSYYYEKIFAKEVSTKQDMLEAISNCLTLTQIEIGIAGEATLAILHGWRYNSSFENQGYTTQNLHTMDEISSEVKELFSGEEAFLKANIGSDELENNIKQVSSPGQSSIVPFMSVETYFEASTPSSKHWVRRVNSSEEDEDLDVSYVTYNPSPSQSKLYAATLQVTELLSEQENLVLDTAYMSEQEKIDLMQKVFEPSHLIDPDPFMIDDKKTGFFYRTEYSFIDLPPLAEGQIPQAVITEMENSALTHVLHFYDKPVNWLYQNEPHDVENHRQTYETLFDPHSEPLIKFIEFRTPSLRPGDVYRAYLEINTQKLDLIEVSSVLPQEQNESGILTNRSAAALSELEESLKAMYCAQGASEEEAAAQVQYEKYRSFAAKKKLEIARKLKSDLLASATSQKDIKDIQIDLGIFGQINISDDQLMQQSVEALGAGIRSIFDQSRETGPQEDTITTKLFRKNVDTVVENFKKTVKDFENYELEGDPNFDVTAEAARIKQSVGEIEKAFKVAPHCKYIARSKNISVQQLFDHPQTELKFFFLDENSSTPPGSSIGTLHVANERFGLHGVILGELEDAEPKGVLKNYRTVNYLRNLRELAGTTWSNFFIPGQDGSVCRDNDSVGGTGVSYVLRYTSGVSVAKRKSIPNPFHDFVSVGLDDAKKFIEKSTDIKRSNKDILSSVAGIPSIDYTKSTILPLIGDHCTLEDLQTDFIKKFKLGALICDLAKCLRLPDVNIKIPNMEPPEWPEIPTFKWPGLDKTWDELEDLLYQILRRAGCTLAYTIMDILSTPFCADNLIEDLYGAGASQTAPAAVRALADTMVDLGIPSDKFDSGKKLIEETTKVLTPREFCALLEGETLNTEVYEVISRFTRLESVNLAAELSTYDQIKNFFSGIGIYIDPELCRNLGKYNKILGSYTCTDVSDSMQQIREKISRAEDVEESQIQNALALAEKNLMTKAKALELFTNEGSLEALIPDLFDPENDLSPLNKVPEAIIESSNIVAEAMFDLPKMSFMTSTRQYVPSMYLDAPRIIDPSDARYDKEAANKSVRAIEILNLLRDGYDDEVSGELSRLDLSMPSSFVTMLELVCTDWEKIPEDPPEEENPNPLGGLYNINEEDSRIDQDESKDLWTEIDTKLSTSDFPAFLNPRRDNEFSAKIANITDDLFPIPLTTPVPLQVEDEEPKDFQIISGWKQYKAFRTRMSGLANENDPTAEALKAEMVRSLEDKFNKQITKLQSDVTSNIDKLFTVTSSKELFTIIKDFYDIEKERLRRTEDKLISADSEAQESIKIKSPYMDPGSNRSMPFHVKVALNNGKLEENNNYIYKVTVSDDFFLGANASNPRDTLQGNDADAPPTAEYTFCEKITNPAVLNISDLSQYPRIEPRIYQNFLTAKTNMLFKKYNNDANIQNFPNREIRDTLFPYALEGMSEQIASSIRLSRIFEDENYIDNLDSRIKGLRYLKPDGCLVNSSGFSTFSILNFDELITKRFMDQFKKEIASPLNSPLYRDYSLPGPAEKAIQNTAVLGFIRICMLELMLKGAITLSVWGPEFIWGEQLYHKYIEDFVKNQINANSIFSEPKVNEMFEDTLVRITGLSNKSSAISRLISEEKAIIKDLARSVFDLPESTEYNNIFVSDIFPFVDVPAIRTNLAAFAGNFGNVGNGLAFDSNSINFLGSRITKSNYRQRTEKSLTFFEKYIRLVGEVKLDNMTPESIAESHLAGITALNNPNEEPGTSYTQLRDGMGFVDPGIENFNIGADQVEDISGLYADNDGFTTDGKPTELMSIPEFSEFMSRILNSNPGLQEYFARVTRRIYDPSNPSIHMAPESIRRAPLKKIVRRRGYFKVDKGDLFSFNRNERNFPFSPNEFSAGTYSRDYNEFLRFGRMPQRSRGYYKELLRDTFNRDESSTLEYNGGQKERYYLIPADLSTETAINSMSLTEQDIIDNKGGIANHTSFYNKHFGFEPSVFDPSNGQNLRSSGALHDRRLQQSRLPAQVPGVGSQPLSTHNTFPNEDSDRINNPNSEDPNSLLFNNSIGEVSKEDFDFFEGQEIEYVDETVIDLVFDGAPVFDNIGETGYNHIEEFDDFIDPTNSNEEIIKISEIPDERAGFLCPQLTADIGNGLRTSDDNQFRWSIVTSVRTPNHEKKAYVVGKLGHMFSDQNGVQRDQEPTGKACYTYGSFDMGLPSSMSPAGFQMGKRQLLRENEIKIPIRIYITQIKDSSGAIKQAYFKYDLPLVLDFYGQGNSNFQAVRRKNFSKYVKRAVTDLMTSYLADVDTYAEEYTSAIGNIVSPDDGSRAGELLADSPDIEGQDGEVIYFLENTGTTTPLAHSLRLGPNFEFVNPNGPVALLKDKVGVLHYMSDFRFPTFTGGATENFSSFRPLVGLTTAGLNPPWRDTKTTSLSFVNRNKVYSRAMHCEVEDKSGNFRMSTFTLDNKFNNPGSLVRRPDVNPRLPQLEVPEGSTQDVISGYVREFNDRKIRATHSLYGPLTMYEILERTLLGSTAENTVTPLTDEQVISSVIPTLGNLMTYTRQQRLESVWGQTYGSSEELFPTSATIGGRRGSSEAHPFLCGPSLMYNDGRGMPHEFLAAANDYNSFTEFGALTLRSKLGAYTAMGAWPGSTRNGVTTGHPPELDSAGTISNNFGNLSTGGYRNLVESIVTAIRNPDEPGDPNDGRGTRITLGSGSRRFTDVSFNKKIKFVNCTLENLNITRHLFEYLDYDLLSKASDFCHMISDMQEESIAPGLDRVQDNVTALIAEFGQGRELFDKFRDPGEPTSDSSFRQSQYMQALSRELIPHLNSKNLPENRAAAVKILREMSRTIGIIRGRYLSVLSSTQGSQGKSILNYFFDVLFSNSAMGIRSIFEDTDILVGARLMTSVNIEDNNNDPEITDLRDSFNSSIDATTCLEERYGIQKFNSAGDQLFPQPLNLDECFISFPVDSYEEEIDICTFYKIEDADAFTDNANSEADHRLLELLKRDKPKAFFNICLPYKKLATMLTIHSTGMLAGYSQMPIVLSSTKSSLSAVFKMASIRDNFYNADSASLNPNFNNIEIYNAMNNFGSSSGPKLECFGGPDLGEWGTIIKEMIEEIIAYFPSYIMRGIAEKIDPAYKEIKHHYMGCNVENFSFLDGGVLTALSVRDDKVPFGYSPRTSDYAPVNLAFPGDLAYSFARLFSTNPSAGARSLKETMLKLTNYIMTGPLPLIDPAYAFEIPCRDFGGSGDLFGRWSKYVDQDLNAYGRYGHPAGLITYLALQTAVIPGEREDKRAFCIDSQLTNNNSNVTDCDDE